MSKEISEFDLEDPLVHFAIQMRRIAEASPKTTFGKHITGQLIGFGSSIMLFQNLVTTRDGLKKTSSFDIPCLIFCGSNCTLVFIRKNLMNYPHLGN